KMPRQRCRPDSASGSDGGRISISVCSPKVRMLWSDQWMATWLLGPVRRRSRRCNTCPADVRTHVVAPAGMTSTTCFGTRIEISFVPEFAGAANRRPASLCHQTRHGKAKRRTLLPCLEGSCMGQTPNAADQLVD